MKSGRKKSFEDIGIPADRIIDFIFNRIENEEPVGYYGNGGEVHEIEIGGASRRVVIVIGGNGYLVTAYPLKKRHKIRPRQKRE
ncbi:hypothetical protein UA75_23305 [Actinoalloteichus sp. GBA129-24]|uniref:Uncharacterized protein n=1 Tax=Actinoalloteichus fjordicus TaxID=1612552 RepID=A0AAC9LGY3_9PSEU|nr:hypothetical protein UA74_22795 [Actinoalloteichus fjordicus]APU22643.1 hypothetical protein UA75_23305 [Actinoalloteichus sp. GBA129-24]